MQTFERKVVILFLSILGAQKNHFIIRQIEYPKHVLVEK